MDKSTTFWTSTFSKRALSFVLALVILLGLLPTAVLDANAANVPAQIKLVNAKYGYSQNGKDDFVSYSSPNGNIHDAYFHYFTMDVNGSVVPGLCLEHQKHMGVSYENQTWENPKLSTLPSGVLRFLDYYYFKVDEHAKAHAETNTACTNAIDADLKHGKFGDQYKNMWSQFDLEFTNAVFQAVVWLAREGKIKDPVNDTAEQEMIAKERYAVGSKVFGNSFADDMDGCRQWVGWVLSAINPATGFVPKRIYYEYSWKIGQKTESYGARKGLQSLLVPVSDPGRDVPDVYIQIKKTDESGDPVPNATFGVYDDNACKHRIGTIVTGTSEWSVSGPLEVRESLGDKFTLWVKELTAPDGYELNPTPASVQVDRAQNNTANTAATTYYTFLNTTHDDPGGGTPEGILRKVDADTGVGVGPATFRFRGQADDGSYVDATYECDGGGSLDLQWSNPSADDYIKPGNYTVTEEVPPVGYQKTDESFNLVLEYNDRTGTSTSSGPITFSNKRLHILTIRKVDADGNGLPGAVFEIYRNGQHITDVTTGPDGMFTYDGPNGMGIETGYYTIIEKTAPAGYLIPYMNHASVMVDAADTRDYEHIIVMKNDMWPEIVIKKHETGTTIPLEGAVFKVTIDGREFGSFTTGMDGTIVIDYDTYGKFWNEGNKTHTVRVEEITAPDGYLIDSPNWQEFEMVEGQTLQTFSFTDTKYPEIVIVKRDRETQAPLANTEFQVAIDGVDIGTFTTDDKGEILINYETYSRFLNEQNYGNWSVAVTETKVPDKYNLDDQPEAVGGKGATVTQVLRFGQSLLTFEFEDTSYRDIKVLKKDAQTGWLLKGASFTLHCISADDKNAGNIADRTLTTDETGSVTFVDVPNGTYELIESNPPQGYSANGYWGDTNQDGKRTVIVKSDSDPVIEFEYYNEPLSGMLIRKIDSVTKQPIPNVEFRITPLAPLTTPSWTATTDDNGLIVKESLPAGTYRIEEVTTVDGYVLNTEAKLVEIDEQHDAYTVTFENNQKNMLNVLKLDAITKEPLAGAIFEVRTAGGTHVANITTGIYGYANLPNLKPGSYVVQEVQAPDGHIIDPMPQTFEVKADDSGNVYTLVFCNSPYANIFIRKYDKLTGVGLEGATFKVWKGNGQIVAENAKTDAQGFIHIGELTADTYFIQETSAPQGYILDDTVYTLHVEDGETKTIEIANQKPGGLAVRKIDTETGEALSGATFELRTIEGTLIGSKTTGADGYVRWEKLNPGWYVLTETEAPAGYAISTTPLNVEIKEFESTELEWKNSQHASLTITKRDKDSEVPLEGATFEVRTMSGQLVTTLTTGANGVATSGRLEPGWYRITETKAPDGYVLNEEEQLVEVTANTPVSVDFFNVAQKGIVIHKVDAITQKPLAGAVFEVRTITNKLVESYTTDSSGTITTKALDPGNYTVVETKAPTGYVLNEEKFVVEVEEGKQSVITVKNYPETIIQIYKTDSVTGDPLQYAEFEILTEAGKTVGFVTTDKTGWANSLTLEPGDYIVKETKAPSGYTLDATEHRVTVTAGENTIVRLTNAPDTSLHISKIDSVTRQPLAGAEFELRYDTGHGDCTYIGTYITDEQGMIHTEPLTPGFYMIKEIQAPEGYAIVTEEYRYCVKAGEYNQLVIENEAMGTLIVRKIDSKSGQPVAGAVFKLENADTSDLIGLKETDANGEAIWTGLKEGFYIVTETQAPDGYTKSECPKTIQIEYGKANYVDFKDDENGSLKIVLQDKNTDEYLYGGHFTVIRESDQIVIFDGSTDVTGTIVVGNLLPGWYTVTQTFPPDKYTMVDVNQKVEILIGEQQTVYFKDVTAGLVIEKVDAQYPELMLEGARFQVKRDTDGVVIGEYVTGKDGLALVDGLEPGLYTISELVAPNGYALDAEPQTVHVKEGTTAHATFLDTALSSITIKIVDANSQEPIPGAVVEVWQQNGVLVNTYTSDITGVIQTDKLPEGHYTLKVISVPDGYTASVTETTVELKNGIETTYKFELTSKGSLKIMSVNSSDKAIAGMRVTITTIEGTNVGEYTTGKDGSAIVDNLLPGWYIVKETKAPDGYSLSSTVEQRIEITSSGQAVVTFRHGHIYGLQILTTCKQTSEKIESASYEIREMNGAVIGTYTSNSAGLIFVELQPGWYTVRPISVPEGYTIPDTQPRNIEVREDGLTTMEFFVNQMSSIRVKVVDASTQRGIYGVRLQLKNANTRIKEYYTDNEGYITLESELLNGGYTLEMISAPDGFIVDTTPKSIKTLVGQTTEIVWALYKEGGQIQVVVTSSDYNKTLDKPAGSALQGAVFEITNADTYQVVGQMISNASGVAASSGLPIGRYTVKMVTAPAYYAVNSTWNPEIRLKINNDVVRVETSVQSVNLASDVSIQSNSTIRAGNSMRVDILSAKNGSDVRLDNFYLHIKVPTDAARITTLSTGSWNHAVFYKIQYKTNMNDYRVLAENLMSTNVYQYGISTQSLGLQSGEYVTDIRMEFGAVPAGFATVQKPCYSQYVLATVYNGYKLISRVELGGQHNTVNVSTSHIDNNNPYSSTGAVVIVDANNSGSYGGTGSPAVSGNSGQWITSSGLWTTTVSSNVQMPSSLPKTGY